MIRQIKQKYRELHITKNMIRIGDFYRYNKKTKKVFNIKNRKPNLIILGSQKCGTTSLFNYL